MFCCAEQVPAGAENFGDTPQVAQVDSATAVSVEPVSTIMVKDWPATVTGAK
jgi:hypothetical protein